MRTAVVDAGTRPILNLFPNPNGKRAVDGSTKNGVAASVNLIATAPTAGTFSGGFKLTPTGASNDSYMHFGDNPVGLFRPSMVPGRTYTATGWITIPAAHTSTNLRPNRARGIAFFVTQGATTELRSPQAPNVAGTYRIVFTFTVPAGAGNGFIRIYNGSDLASDIVYWHHLTLTEGPTVPDYCGPETPGWIEFADGTTAGLPYTLGRVLSGLPGPIGQTDVNNPTLSVSQTGLLGKGSWYSVMNIGTGFTQYGGFSTTNSAILFTQTSSTDVTQAVAGFRGTDALYYARDSNALSSNRAAVISAVRTSATLGSVMANGRTRVSQPLNGYGTQDVGAIKSSSTAVYPQVISGLLFNEAHSETQERAIHTWLMNHYGISISSNLLDSATLDTMQLG